MSNRFWSMKRVLAAAVWAMALLIGQLTLQSIRAADSVNPYVGTWSGTWEGVGADGLIDFTLRQDSSGKLLGSIDVVQDEGTFSADFLMLELSENKLTTKYEFKLNPEQEIVFAGTFHGSSHGSSATGTWSLRKKGEEEIVASGTWKSAKK